MGPPKFYTRGGLTQNRFKHSCLMRMHIKLKNVQSNIHSSLSQAKRFNLSKSCIHHILAYRLL